MNQVITTAREEILAIGSVDLNIQPNHRFFHIVNFLSAKFRTVDFLSYANLYGGPPTSIFRKVIKSIHNLIFDRRRIYQVGNVRYIVIRKLKLPQFLQNLIGDIWIYINLPKWLKKKNYNLCIYSHPHNVFLIRFLKGSKVIGKILYDDCDFFPDHLDATDFLSSKVLSWKEHLAVSMAEGVISVSQSLACLRRKQGAKKVIVVPNGVKLDFFLGDREREPHPPTLIYVGLLSEPWGVDLVLKAMPLVRNEIPDIKFMIVGDGEYRTELQNMTTRLGLKDIVTFLGKIPYDKLLKFLNLADIGVATYKDRKFLEYASPLKIREYMAAGLPVIASKIGESEGIIKISRAGELVDHSPTSISSATIKILSDAKLYKEYSDNAVRYAINFDWENVLEPILNLTEAV